MLITVENAICHLHKLIKCEIILNILSTRTHLNVPVKNNERKIKEFQCDFDYCCLQLNKVIFFFVVTDPKEKEDLNITIIIPKKNYT